MKLCPICCIKRQVTFFPRLRNGRRGRFCEDCRPVDPLAELAVIHEAAEFVQHRSEVTPCIECKLAAGVLYYRKDGKCCDVHGMAQAGTSTWFLRRLLSSLTPLCQICASKQTPQAKASKSAEFFKGKALREPDEAKKQRYWAMHYAFREQERQNDG